ncbi:MAG: sulfotransferase [Ignavibacteria bacterium]
MIDNYNLVLIGGTGRSGSNITKQVLSKHSKIATLPYEHRFTIDPNGILDFYNTIKFSWSPYICHKKLRDLIKLLNSLNSRNYFRYFIGSLISKIDPHSRKFTAPPYYGWELEKWFPNYLLHVRNLVNDLIEFRYHAIWPGEKAFNYKNKMLFVSSDIAKLKNITNKFFNNMISDLLVKTQKQIFVEDNTWNLLFVGSYIEILPQVKFIHVIRDPRDVIGSLIKQRWSPNNLDHCIEYYINLITKILEQAEGLTEKQLLIVKLEDVVNNTREEIKKICKHCGVGYEENLSNVDLSKANIGRWELDFNEAQKVMLNQKLNKFIRIFEYN